MISTKAAKVLFGKSERNGALMKSQTNALGIGRLYEIKVNVRLQYMKSIHSKWKLHENQTLK